MSPTSNEPFDCQLACYDPEQRVAFDPHTCHEIPDINDDGCAVDAESACRVAFGLWIIILLSIILLCAVVIIAMRFFQ